MTFLQNGYCKGEIERVLAGYGKRCVQQQGKDEEDITRCIAVVSYCSTVINCLTSLLQRRKIKTVSCPLTKTKLLMRSVKDLLGLNVPGVFKVPCMCRSRYLGQAGRSVLIRQREHWWHLHLGNIEKSTLAHQSWHTGHTICFQDTEVLYKSMAWKVRMVRESLKNPLRQTITNEKDGVKLSSA